MRTHGAGKPLGREHSRADVVALLDPVAAGRKLRRKGAYSSSLSTWQRQREAAELAALAPQKRGPKPDVTAAEARQVVQLTRENERLKSQFDKARLAIKVEKSCRILSE